jgi:hypothetical protein
MQKNLIDRHRAIELEAIMVRGRDTYLETRCAGSPRHAANSFLPANRVECWATAMNENPAPEGPQFP